MAIDRTFITGANLNLDIKAALHGAADQIDAVVTVPSVTASTADLNTVSDVPASMTTAATPATGTCGVQFVFKDADAVTLAHAVSMHAYFSNSTGLAVAAATSGATLTNGSWTDIVAGTSALAITSAAGLLGVTVTASAGSYYITFVLPNGKLLTSSILTVN